MGESDADWIAGLFEPAVEVGAMRCKATFSDLLPTEQGSIVAATALRQHDFASGRVCARRVLARFGITDVALPVQADGTPRWPAGFVGSIAHSGGVVVVAIARDSLLAGLGIDVEAARGIEASAWDLLCTPRELAQLRRERDAQRGQLLATAFFSAKESAYKALRSQCQTRFEPRAIELEWDGLDTIFRAHCGTQEIDGRLLCREKWIVSGATLKRAT